MKITSIIAIYALFWVMCAFMALPFGVKTHEEAGVPMIPVQADSAPANFSLGRIAKRATVASLILFALYYVNWTNGWITAKDLNFFGSPPNYDGTRN